MTHGVKVIEMAAAYQVFGNGGIYNEPYCYYEVRNSDGEIILSKKNQSEIALTADSAWVMNKILQTVTAPGQGGTGQRFGLSAYGIETFGKSGSTNDYCDVWFCGGSPYYVTAIWTGFDESKPLNVYAGNTSGIIWSAVIKSIDSGLPSAQFAPSESVVELIQCTVSGLIAGDNCESTAKGWYKVSYTGGTCTTCQESFNETPSDEEIPQE
jgi:penicillin-binding protein 1A